MRPSFGYIPTPNFSTCRIITFSMPPGFFKSRLALGISRIIVSSSQKDKKSSLAISPALIAKLNFLHVFGGKFSTGQNTSPSNEYAAIKKGRVCSWIGFRNSVIGSSSVGLLHARHNFIWVSFSDSFLVFQEAKRSHNAISCPLPFAKSSLVSLWELSSSEYLIWNSVVPLGVFTFRSSNLSPLKSLRSIIISASVWRSISCRIIETVK